MGTKDKITRKALELFNRKGIEYVGMRELAASLSMQIGNITYYYPTKDDLVNQLALDLSAINAKTIASPGELTLMGFLEMQEAVFKNQHEYRCLFLSFVHLIRQNPIIAERYQKIGKRRGDDFKDQIKLLQDAKYLVRHGPKDNDFLAGTIGLISRFWISEAEIGYSQLSVDQRIHRYSGLIAGILHPYATSRGREQIDKFING